MMLSALDTGKKKALSVPDATKNVTVKRTVIMPGEHCVSWSPAEVVTLLGSCVAACIWDSKLKIGGMNHFMLPDPPAVQKNLTDQTKSLRYGLYAMERLINDLLVMGAKRENLIAKVFGGANMTNVLSSQNIGQRNAGFVIDFLQKDQIRIHVADLLGSHSRRIEFNTQTGLAVVNKVIAADFVIAQQEKRYRTTVNKDPVIGQIVFF